MYFELFRQCLQIEHTKEGNQDHNGVGLMISLSSILPAGPLPKHFRSRSHTWFSSH